MWTVAISIRHLLTSISLWALVYAVESVWVSRSDTAVAIASGHLCSLPHPKGFTASCCRRQFRSSRSLFTSIPTCQPAVSTLLTEAVLPPSYPPPPLQQQIWACWMMIGWKWGQFWQPPPPACYHTWSQYSQNKHRNCSSQHSVSLARAVYLQLDISIFPMYLYPLTLQCWRWRYALRFYRSDKLYICMYIYLFPQFYIFFENRDRIHCIYVCKMVKYKFWTLS
jgi:hypothetical protein